MHSEYEKLVQERDAMKQVVDNGRKGTPYHQQAIARYKSAQDKIKQLCKQRYTNGR